MQFFKFTVPDDFSGKERLDKYIAATEPQMGRSKLKSGVVELLVNSQAAKLSSKIKAGDKIEIEWDDSVPDDIEPQNIPLDIIYEDGNVTVVNKAQGMVTHPANGNWQGTLVNALLYHWGRSSVSTEEIESHRPGIVHRLDKDTSGIIITAKNRETEQWLGNQFKEHDLIKEYIAIVSGCPKKRSGDIVTQIVRDPRDRKKYRAVDNTTEGKRAESLYKVVAVYGPYSIVLVRLKTGRTHQIRVHMKHEGCPVLGDAIYGKKDKHFTDVNLLLHARVLGISLPGKSDKSLFFAPLPERFVNVINILQEKFSLDYCDSNLIEVITKENFICDWN